MTPSFEDLSYEEQWVLCNYLSESAGSGITSTKDALSCDVAVLEALVAKGVLQADGLASEGFAEYTKFMVTPQWRTTFRELHAYKRTLWELGAWKVPEPLRVT
jgi:hypothetical protein